MLPVSTWGPVGQRKSLGKKTTPSLDWRGEMHTVCVICAFESWYHHCKIENNLKYMFSPHGLELCQSMVYHLYWIYVIFIWNWPWSYTILLAFNTVDTGVYAKFACELLFAKLSVFLYMPMLLHEIEYWWFKCVALINWCKWMIPIKRQFQYVAVLDKNIQMRAINLRGNDERQCRGTWLRLFDLNHTLCLVWRFVR